MKRGQALAGNGLERIRMDTVDHVKLLAVFTTTATRDEAQRLAATLVQRKLVACAQISEIESFYSWDGVVQHEGEFRLLLKTTAPQYTAVEAAIRELHSYEVPAIFALPVEAAFGPYEAWVSESSTGRG